VKILIAIENSMYVRNFVQSGAFSELHDVTYAISDGVIKMGNAIPTPPLRWVRHAHNLGITYACNKVSSRCLADKSSTFRIKVEAGQWGEYGVDEQVIASAPIEQVRSFFAQRFQKNESLARVIEKAQPDLVIWPMTGVESTGTELIQMSEPYGFKTLFLVNGWDNLCSKGVLPLLPDALGVWGPQQLADAVTIQGAKSHQCHLIGCARYAAYFADIPRPSHFDFPYVLFCGAATPCDELTALHICDGVSDVKIVYRPHPWREKRQCFDIFLEEDFTNVVLDPQVAESYYREKRQGTESSSSRNYPDLSYYPALVANAQFVISPLSSMTLEAALLNVPALILGYDDGIHALHMGRQKDYHHFEGWETVRGWRMVEGISNLAQQFEAMPPDTRGLRESMRRYLYWDERSYAERLADLAEVVM